MMTDFTSSFVILNQLELKIVVRDQSRNENRSSCRDASLSIVDETKRKNIFPDCLHVLRGATKTRAKIVELIDGVAHRISFNSFENRFFSLSYSEHLRASEQCGVINYTLAPPSCVVVYLRDDYLSRFNAVELKWWALSPMNFFMDLLLEWLSIILFLLFSSLLILDIGSLFGDWDAMSCLGWHNWEARWWSVLKYLINKKSEQKNLLKAQEKLLIILKL